jgi:hypothetical protein
MTCLSATPFSGQSLTFPDGAKSGGTAQQHRESMVHLIVCILRVMRSSSTLQKRAGDAMEVHMLSRLSAFNIVYGVIAGEFRAIEI